uniref:Uncharacterized protein n=1 Tax=Pararge aegeria TaxID=116150 RepID=S4NTJ1_9NEOP
MLRLPWSQRAYTCLRDIKQRLPLVTRAGSLLAQRISLAVQCGNAASVLGTITRGYDITVTVISLVLL